MTVTALKGECDLEWAHADEGAGAVSMALLMLLQLPVCAFEAFLKRLPSKFRILERVVQITCNQ